VIDFDALFRINILNSEILSKNINTADPPTQQKMLEQILMNQQCMMIQMLPDKESFFEKLEKGIIYDATQDRWRWEGNK
jgi:hypothetical protein